MRALSRSAGRRHQIALAVLANHTRMQQNRLPFGCRKGIRHHQGVIQRKGTICFRLVLQHHRTRLEKAVGIQHAAIYPATVVNLNLISAIRQNTHTIVISAAVEMSYLLASALIAESVVHSQFKQRALALHTLCHKRSKRRNQSVTVSLVLVPHMQQMTAYAIETLSHGFGEGCPFCGAAGCDFFSASSLGEVSTIVVSTHSSVLK